MWLVIRYSPQFGYCPPAFELNVCKLSIPSIGLIWIKGLEWALVGFFQFFAVSLGQPN